MVLHAKAVFRFALLATALFLGGIQLAPKAGAQGDRGGMPGDFDYYILALSWSPTYCDNRDSEERGRYRDEDRYDDRRSYSPRRGDSDEQCNGVRPYAFVLHGLWPQYERRGWPEMCETRDRPWVPEETIEKMLDIMPSRRLVIQEYRKHGVCSGLDANRYFEAARRAYRSIRIPEEFQDLSRPLSISPDEIRKAFLEVNRQLSPDMIQIVCSRRLLRELRVCLTKDLEPRSCSQSERRLCTYEMVTLPRVRGGGAGPRGGPSYGRGGERL